MKRQFRPGSVVKLKSGGSNMIVVKYEMQQLSGSHSDTEITIPDIAALVSVTWFEDGKWKGGKFDPNLLVLVK
jgi:uncharacterized protein YodC (DUF2158 family)